VSSDDLRRHLAGVATARGSCKGVVPPLLSSRAKGDWFKGKSTGNHGLLQSTIGVACKFSPAIH